MSFEYSLHEIEAARLARIHAGTGEREQVRVWEVKPRVRTEADEAADNQTLLGQSAQILKHALARGAVKLAPVIPVELRPKRRGRRWTAEQKLEQGRKLKNRHVSKVTREKMSFAAQHRKEATL